MHLDDAEMYTSRLLHFMLIFFLISFINLEWPWADILRYIDYSLYTLYGAPAY